MLSPPSRWSLLISGFGASPSNPVKVTPLLIQLCNNLWVINKDFIWFDEIIEIAALVDGLDYPGYRSSDFSKALP